jgi:hypothetical protein
MLKPTKLRDTWIGSECGLCQTSFPATGRPSNKREIRLAVLAKRVAPVGCPLWRHGSSVATAEWFNWPQPLVKKIAPENWS